MHEAENKQEFTALNNREKEVAKRGIEREQKKLQALDNAIAQHEQLEQRKAQEKAQRAYAAKKRVRETASAAFTASEWQEIEDRAKAEGKSVAEWFRDASIRLPQFTNQTAEHRRRKVGGGTMGRPASETNVDRQSGDHLRVSRTINVDAETKQRLYDERALFGEAETYDKRSGEALGKKPYISESDYLHALAFNQDPAAIRGHVAAKKADAVYDHMSRMERENNVEQEDVAAFWTARILEVRAKHGLPTLE
ncbi:hypothetical protein [Leifsonia sp. NPDC080035]|uniref:Uncharacterized protein n=1 Tax=Leifsonia sp. NPDC080035 TaxID=3143936 RepID=A0AAU7GC67_9MICO